VNLARLCPRFLSCCVNRCPLDSRYPEQMVHPADTEKKCQMGKSVRIRIADTAPGQLPLNGLTVAEHSAKRLFESKPVADRIKLARQGKDALNTLRA